MSKEPGIYRSQIYYMKQLTQVYEFHKAFNHPIQTEPRWPEGIRCELRQNLVAEEADEFFKAVDERNMTETADAICDLMYVILGAALEFGLGSRLELMFDEVHRSNMSKLGEGGKPVYREDGKSLKGPNFSPPDLKTILES